MEGCHHHGWHGGHGQAGNCGCAGRFDEQSSFERCTCGQHHGHAHHTREGEDVRLRRRFRSREERLAELEKYRNELQAELKGVEEHIAELKSGT